MRNPDDIKGDLGKSLWLRSLKAGTWAWIVSLIVSSPPLMLYRSPPHGPPNTGNRFYDVFVQQVNNPLYRPIPGTNKHWSGCGNFLGYRICVPLVAHILKIGPWGGVAIISLAGLASMVVIHNVLLWKSVDQTLASWFVIGLGTTPLLQGSHIYIGFPDSVAWLMVALMMRIAVPWAWILLVFIGLFNDERICVALPFALSVLLFAQRTDFRSLFRAAAPYAAAIAAGVGLALTVRQGIKNGLLGGAPFLGPELPIEIFMGRWSTSHTINLLSSYAFFWVLPPLAVLLDRRARWFWSVVGVYTAIAVVVSTIAFDFWRSLGAIYPLFILAFLTLADVRPPWLTNVVRCCVASMVLRPQGFSAGSLKWIRPLPIALTEWYHASSILKFIQTPPW